MAKLFISHAGDDKKFVDKFVNTIVRLGCGVKPESIFYSSGSDVAVPSGTDLNTYIRDQMGEVSLVIALITPTFVTRPYCLAELGASWSRVGNLFPLTAGVPRSELDGVLKGGAVRDVGHAPTLNELHDRISHVLGTPTPATTWGEHRDAWLADLDSSLGELKAVRLVDVISITSCARGKGHMEVFWTNGAGAVSFRRWEGFQEWSAVQELDGPEADHVAAVCPEEDEPQFREDETGRGEMLFGVRGAGQVWVRRWVKKGTGALGPGPVEWIEGEVVGPIAAVSRGRDVELFAWTREGEQCHLWSQGNSWSDWTSRWA